MAEIPYWLVIERRTVKSRPRGKLRNLALFECGPAELRGIELAMVSVLGAKVVDVRIGQLPIYDPTWEGCELEGVLEKKNGRSHVYCTEIVRVRLRQKVRVLVEIEPPAADVEVRWIFGCDVQPYSQAVQTIWRKK